jgi:penicillin-binding protein 1C
MDGVSGVSGAGPLLHRVVLATARRYPVGSLQGPRAAGALPTTICRLSGRRPGPACPTVTEWFAPGHGPIDTCRWHDADGGVRLPAEYAEWMERPESPSAAPPPEDIVATEVEPAQEFRIVSPSEGDLYRLPPGVDSRYATVALRTAGRGAGGTVRWTVDGAPYHRPRWALQEGRHRLRAISAAGDTAEVAFTVE